MRQYGSAWLQAALRRALRTVGQAALSAIGTGAMLREVDWRAVVSTAVLAGLVSLLTSLTGLPEVSGSRTERQDAGGPCV